MLFRSGTLKGVGPVMIDTLEQLGIATIADALFHFPTSIIDRRNRIRLSQASIGDLITVELKVTAIEQGFGGRPHLIVCMDMDGSPLEVRYFCSPTMTLMKWSEIKREYKVNSDIILSIGELPASLSTPIGLTASSASSAREGGSKGSASAQASATLANCLA